MTIFKIPQIDVATLKEEAADALINRLAAEIVYMKEMPSELVQSAKLLFNLSLTQTISLYELLADHLADQKSYNEPCPHCTIVE